MSGFIEVPLLGSKKYFIFLLICLFICLSIFSKVEAQNSDLDKCIIDSVVIENRNIFNLENPDYKYWLFKLANKLHIRTKKSVVKRELLIGKGTFFSRRLADETERNLRELPYIWSASIALETSDSAGNIIRVITSDRWTLLSGITINRLAGQTTYKIGIEELNFFGYGQYIKFDYFFREYEENYADFSFLERRLLGSRNMLSLEYKGDPEIGSKIIGISRPLYSLNTQFGYSVNFTDIDCDDIYYSSGVEVARERYFGKLFSATSTYRFGTYHSKVNFGITYQYHDIGISNGSDSLYHGLIPTVGIGHYKYIRTSRINNFSRIEDFSVFKDISLSVGWYIDSENHHCLYRTISPSLSFSEWYKSNLILFSISRTTWYIGGKDYRKRTILSIRYYNNSLSWLTPAFYALYREDRRPDNRESLYPLQNRGLRGYPENYISGEKLARLNIENRIYTGLKVLTAEIGLVQFFDLGQGWNRNESFKYKETLWSVGFGLRIGVDKISGGGVNRIDLAYAEKLKSWQLSFGIGQYF